MHEDVLIKNGIVIPSSEIEITSSKSGGPGGQHVNKTNTRIILRWNVKNTIALNDEQKVLVLDNLKASLTSEGDLIIFSSESRSQQQNKQLALIKLVKILNKALYIPKKRIATKASKAAKESRLREKIIRSKTKELRSKKIQDY